MKATKLLTLFVVPILLFQLGGCDAESGLEKTNKLPVVQNNEIADDIFSDRKSTRLNSSHQI